MIYFRKSGNLIPQLRVGYVWGGLLFFVFGGILVGQAADRPDFKVAGGILEKAIEDKVFPGCTVAVGDSSRIHWSAGFGFTDYSRSSAVSSSTIYDLASLTKVVGTTSVFMRLVGDGRIGLKDPVVKWLPEFASVEADSGKDEKRNKVTVEHLLTHTSGLPAWVPFYEDVDSYKELIKAVVSTSMEVSAGTRYKYSDLGFILLGEIAGRVMGRRLGELEREWIFQPLKMNRTMRNPKPEWWRFIAPTEIPPGESEAILGFVHDENSRSGEGLTGHAGLFSDVDDLSVFARELLKAQDHESKVFNSGTVRLFTRRGNVIPDYHRGIGWALATGQSSAGTVLSRDAFGHTGFTGTSLWMDGDLDLFVILLTNRVHPTRKNSRIPKVRTDLANEVGTIWKAWRKTGKRGPVNSK
ncbi:MAG TPA: class A beta-lactamase-related serine hydrolase [Verrucomicrobiales bacterium]|nr:class A beta-lactamase-related serine hydrolase [Verrucomicrobiales bacterium]HIL69565.1 class A beta-lactamase-related serine hydrolase [Verrucomicrobiota bacterium]